MCKKEVGGRGEAYKFSVGILGWADSLSGAIFSFRGAPQGNRQSMGHHRGIGRAIELPYRALINTLLLILILLY